MRWLGGMSVLVAMLVVAGATVLGVIFTLIAGQDPGAVLGVLVIIGSLAATLGIRRSAVYLLFPLPALALFLGALLAGVVHDSQLASSTAGFGAGSLQWFAGIFFPMVVGTVLVLLTGGGRWLFGSQLVTGRGPRPAGLATAPAAARSAPGARRSTVSGSWAAEDPFAAGNPGTGPLPRPGTGPTPRQGTGPTPRPGTGPTPRQGTGPAPRPGTGPAPRQGTGPTPQQGTGPAPRQGTGPAPRQGTGQTPRPGAGTNRPPRPARDPRTDRDPWGDPRLPADRQPPTGPRPAGPPPQPQPQPQPQPRERSPRPGPSWNPAPRPPRPPRPSRPQPPEDWNPR